MTPLKACKETQELWNEMGKEAEINKVQFAKQFIPGPWNKYKNNCPCCEYTKQKNGSVVCRDCPMLEKWTFIIGHIYDQDTYCEHGVSPYEKWRQLAADKTSVGRKTTSCIDVAFFCYLIADLAEEAAEEIEREWSFCNYSLSKYNIFRR